MYDIDVDIWEKLFMHNFDVQMCNRANICTNCKVLYSRNFSQGRRELFRSRGAPPNQGVHFGQICVILREISTFLPVHPVHPPLRRFIHKWFQVQRMLNYLCFISWSERALLNCSQSSHQNITITFWYIHTIKEIDMICISNPWSQ